MAYCDSNSFATSPLGVADLGSSAAESRGHRWVPMLSNPRSTSSRAATAPAHPGVGAIASTKPAGLQFHVATRVPMQLVRRARRRHSHRWRTRTKRRGAAPSPASAHATPATSQQFILFAGVQVQRRARYPIRPTRGAAYLGPDGADQQPWPTPSARGRPYRQDGLGDLLTGPPSSRSRRVRPSRGSSATTCWHRWPDNPWWRPTRPIPTVRSPPHHPLPSRAYACSTKHLDNAGVLTTTLKSPREKCLLRWTATGGVLGARRRR